MYYIIFEIMKIFDNLTQAMAGFDWE